MMTVEDIMNKYDCRVQQYLYTQAPKFNQALYGDGYSYVVVEVRSVKASEYMKAKYNVIAFKSEQDSDEYCVSVGDSAYTKQYIIQDGLILCKEKKRQPRE